MPMPQALFWITNASIKSLFLPLKGPIQVITPKELPKALKNNPFSSIYLWVDDPELAQKTKDLAAQFPEKEITFLETQEEALSLGLSLLADGLAPEDIERLSFEIIGNLMPSVPKDLLLLPVLKRVIHATGDPSFGRTLCFSSNALSFGMEALKAGKHILVDVEMLSAGVNKKRLSALGGKVLCGLSEVKSPLPGKTRTETAIETMLAKHPDIGIVAVGNAPTALLATLRFLRKNPRELLIVGLPVGFVKAAEAKLLLRLHKGPYITNFGPRGGTPAACAILNALIGLAHEKEA